MEWGKIGYRAREAFEGRSLNEENLAGDWQQKTQKIVRPPADRPRTEQPGHLMARRPGFYAPVQRSVWEVWRDVPLSTKLYFGILLSLLVLLLLLILVRLGRMSMDLTFVGWLVKGVETPQVTQTPGSFVAPGKPAVTAVEVAEIRNGPGSNFEQIGTVQIGQSLEVVGVSQDRRWWAVDIPYVQRGRAWVAVYQVMINFAEGVPVLDVEQAQAVGEEGSAALSEATPEPVLATALINVNVRSGPGVDYDIIGLLEEGQAAEVVGVDGGRTWYAVKLYSAGDLQGWVSKDYVKVAGGDNLPVLSQDLGIPMLIPLTLVNVRAGPGQEYQVVGSLEKGKGAEVVGVSENGEWWKIKFPSGPDGFGWVSAKFVKVEHGDKAPVVK